MKTLTLLLLITNLAVFTYFITLGQNKRVVKEDLNNSELRDSQVPSLTLLSELVSQITDSAPMDEQNLQTCLYFGSFSGLDAGKEFADLLVLQGYDADLELDETAKIINYRVFMPPFLSQTAARRMLEELQENNIESFIIANGELSQGISLGLFSQEQLALSLQENLAGRGYPSSIQEVERSANAIQVKVTGLEISELAQNQWQNLLSEWPEVQSSDKLCETIAPSL